jgi:hypothetical protein
MKRSKEFYLLLLEYALINIRASQFEGKTELGPKLADMFHNVPGALGFPWTQEREEDVYAHLRSKADVYGLVTKLDQWEKLALRQLEESARNHAEASIP